MNKLTPLFIFFSLYLASCESHNADDIELFILNETTSEILFKSFNLGQGDFSYSSIDQNDSYLIGGGGILNVDSLQFIRVTTFDTLVYRNNRHGGNLTEKNHFFNRDNWKEERFNKFYFYLTKNDFDN